MNGDDNGNGYYFPKPIDIDVTDEHAFRTGVVQHLQFIVDNIADIPTIRRKVDKHESIVRVGKWAAVPALGLIQGGLRHIMNKLGW